VTDEFIEPIVIEDKNGEPLTRIQSGDVVIFFNFRTDRPRQLIRALSQEDFQEEGMHKMPLYLVTMTKYDRTFRGVHVIFEPQEVTSSFGEYIDSKGLSQLRIAETEKYPHVTYFFSNGREIPFDRERRILIPSPKVATYDLKPEMSAVEVTGAVVNEIRTNPPDFICLNFANADMVGHTGVFEAAVKACETVDTCLKQVVEAGLEHDYSMIITADHGNADYMVNPGGQPHTAHTLNPVPVFVIPGEANAPLRKGTLIDVAPTLCYLMGLPVPDMMTGRVLFEPSLIKAG
jgi:2,3-bisphosphoglycerate-independent phosphoglycerate mutase